MIVSCSEFPLYPDKQDPEELNSPQYYLDKAIQFIGTLKKEELIAVNDTHSKKGTPIIRVWYLDESM